MCRSIHDLRHVAVAPTSAEVEAAARQFVRKVSGYRVPPQRHVEAFEAAVAEVARTTSALLATVGTSPPSRATPRQRDALR